MKKFRFSKEKKQLRKGEFEKLTDPGRVRDRIAQNRLAALESEIARRGRGIFAVENFEKHFSLDGSIVLKSDPARSAEYGSFFQKKGRLATKNGTFYLRGTNFLTAIDTNLEVRQKLEILLEDFADGLTVLRNTNSESRNDENFLERLAVIDYVKNAAVTLLNAITQEEKAGVFRLDDRRYQYARSVAIQLSQHATHAFYAQMAGNYADVGGSIRTLTTETSRFEETVTYLEEEYAGGIFQNTFFTRPEAASPLVIGASIISTVEKNAFTPDTILGLPSGGTELSMALQYAYKSMKGRTPDLVLAPLSLHTGKDLQEGGITNGRRRDNIEVFLAQHRDKFDDKKVLLIEDNSSTGRTIQILSGLLQEEFRMRKFALSLAEADITRSVIDRDNPERSNVATRRTYTRAVNILPVSKVIDPKVDMKEIQEKQRFVKEYQRLLEESKTEEERIMYTIFLRNIQDPTTNHLKEFTPENSITYFRYTFLSNFYIVPVEYQGVTYPSVEHAYHAQKFSPVDLEKMSPPIMEEIYEEMRKRGYTFAKKNLTGFFLDPTTGSGNAKIVSEILRRHGYMRPGWDAKRVLLMISLLLRKFAHPRVQKMLLDTGDKYLVEGNDWGDTSWGISDSKGSNLLGLILMELRDRYRRGTLGD